LAENGRDERCDGCEGELHGGGIGVVVFVSVSGETFVVMPCRCNNRQYAVTDFV